MALVSRATGVECNHWGLVAQMVNSVSLEPVALNSVKMGTPKTGIMPLKCSWDPWCVTLPSAVQGWTGGVSAAASGLVVGVPPSALSCPWLSDTLWGGTGALVMVFVPLLLYLDFPLPRSCGVNSTSWRKVVVVGIFLLLMSLWLRQLVIAVGY